MSEFEKVIIEHSYSRDVGQVWYDWPDSLQRFFINQEMLISAARGRHAQHADNECSGSHGNFVVRRILYFQLPAALAPAGAKAMPDGPREIISPDAAHSRGAVGAVSCEGTA